MTMITMTPGRSASILCAGILAAAALAGAQALPGWSQQKKIFMNTTATGANVAAEVKGFPVPVLLTEANFDFSKAKSDGSDIRFTGSTGAPLPYEIEAWDGPGKTAAIWVKTDVKGNDNSQFITMHFGNPGAASESDGKKVFPVANGWMGVWHLAEKGSTASGTYKDATENATHGKGIKMTGDATAPGRVGPAVNLDVTKGEFVRIEGAETKPIFQLTSKATYSIWANAKSHKINYQGIFTKGEKGFRIHYYGTAESGDNRGKNITEPCVEVDGGDFCPVEGVKQGADQGTAYLGVDVKIGEWFHLLVVTDKPKVSYYINGAHRVTWSSGGNWTAGNEPLSIGNNADRARSYDGKLDEARILNTVQDSNWIKLDYESQKEGGKFLAFGESGTGVGADLQRPWSPMAGQTIRRFDIHGRLVASILSTGNERADARDLARNARPGVHIDRILAADGAILETKRVNLP